MNNTDAISASDMSTVNTVSPADQTDATSTSDKCTVITVSPGDQTDAASSLPDCCNTRIFKKYDGLIACNKKLGCDHCAKCDSMNIKGIRVSSEWANCSVKASGKNYNHYASISQEKNKEVFFIKGT